MVWGLGGETRPATRFSRAAMVHIDKRPDAAAADADQKTSHSLSFVLGGVFSPCGPVFLGLLLTVAVLALVTLTVFLHLEHKSENDPS